MAVLLVYCCAVCSYSHLFGSSRDGDAWFCCCWGGKWPFGKVDTSVDYWHDFNSVWFLTSKPNRVACVLNIQQQNNIFIPHVEKGINVRKKATR